MDKSICKQRSTYDCMLACIAMAVQKPYEELWPEEFKKKIEDAHGTHGAVCREALEIAGLIIDKDYWIVRLPMEWAAHGSLRQLLNGRRALLQVPSLNNFGEQHIVFWSGETLHDPSNKQIYKWIEQCSIQNVWIFKEIGS